VKGALQFCHPAGHDGLLFGKLRLAPHDPLLAARVIGSRARRP
jgi:hypothetical protein